jgi:hypothetical protein
MASQTNIYIFWQFLIFQLIKKIISLKNKYLTYLIWNLQKNKDKLKWILQINMINSSNILFSLILNNDK